MNRPVIMMCPPDHFTVQYRINPWMQPEEWSKRGPELLAQAQQGWHRLVGTLKDLGAEIVIQPAQAGVPDLVFTANAAVVLDGTAVLARFRHPERIKEEPHNKAFFEQLQKQGKVQRVVELPDGITVEGAGDAVWDGHREIMWVGYGPRSDARGAGAIGDALKVRVETLELVNPRYYHLDTCLAVLDGGHIMYVPEAFSPAGLKLIHDHIPESLRIAVRSEDAEQLAVNAVCLNKTVVLSHCSAPTRASLEKAGYKVHEANISQFGMSGGSVCCLTLRLERRSKRG